jgi:hypothetical protein
MNEMIIAMFQINNRTYAIDMAGQIWVFQRGNWGRAGKVDILPPPPQQMQMSMEDLQKLQNSLRS